MKYVVNDDGALVAVFWTKRRFKAFHVVGKPKDGLFESEDEREQHLKELIRSRFPDAPGREADDPAALRCEVARLRALAVELLLDWEDAQISLDTQFACSGEPPKWEGLAATRRAALGLPDRDTAHVMADAECPQCGRSVRHSLPDAECSFCGWRATPEQRAWLARADGSGVDPTS